MFKLWYLLHNFFLLVEFSLRAALIKAVNRDPITQRRKLAHNTHRTAKKYLKSLKIRLSIHHSSRLQKMQEMSYLAISNHTSYTDILILASLQDFVFITSEEMGSSPFLGTITRNGGCLYTNRKKYVSLPKEIERFARTISDGFKVMLFPEGTSTNGDTVKQFRSSLFQTAYLAACPILPMCIRYLSLDGKPIDSSNRDLLYWYGDMTFSPHFWKLMGHSIEAEVHILEPIMHPDAYNRRDLSEQIHTLIKQTYLGSKVASSV